MATYSQNVGAINRRQNALGSLFASLTGYEDPAEFIKWPNHPYWALRIKNLTRELRELVKNDEQVDAWIDNLPDNLNGIQFSEKIANQIRLEKLHRLQDETCSCFGLGEPCPVCQAMADQREVEF